MRYYWYITLDSSLIHFKQITTKPVYSVFGVSAKFNLEPQRRDSGSKTLDPSHLCGPFSRSIPKCWVAIWKHNLCNFHKFSWLNWWSLNLRNSTHLNQISVTNHSVAYYQVISWAILSLHLFLPHLWQIPAVPGCWSWQPQAPALAG